MIYNNTLEPAVVECQACGKTLRELSWVETQNMVHNPYAYIAYCKTPACQDQLKEDMAREGLL